MERTQEASVLAFLREEAEAYFGRMGLTGTLPLPDAFTEPERFTGLPDPALDDSFRLDWDGERLSIRGSNARACLLGFYRFLKKLGCRFPRPGRVWEVVPDRVVLPEPFSLEEKASYRHRGVCIEGADSVENVLDYIDWLPKIGCNSFFLQFFYSFDFLRKWYEHLDNPYLKPENYTMARHLAHDRAMIEAMRKRGVLHQRGGHGWTAKALGYDGLSWERAEDNASIEKYRDRAAEINGVRGLFHQRPLMTNLCLSNKEAEGALVEEVCRYAAEHPEVDVLHVWLSDALNGVCECEGCRKHRPSDQYVAMLNALDRELTARGLGTKICFLLYLDLLWEPLEEKLEHPERFILMFAPISRTFEHSMAETAYPPEVPRAPFVRNHLKLPVNLPENLGFLAAWQQTVRSDSFIYDYPLGRAHYGDLGYMKIAKVIGEDVENLGRLGLNGYISCQELRTALPSALPNYVMGHKLWDREADFDALAEEYFAACYGAAGREVRASLEALSRLSDTDYVNGKMKPKQEALAARFAEGEEAALALEALTARLLEGPLTEQERRYTEELSYYAGYARRQFKALSLRASFSDEELQAGQGMDALKAARRDALLYLQKGELAHQAGVDVYRIIEVTTNYTKFPGFEGPFDGYEKQITMSVL